MFSEGKWFNPGGAAFDTTLIGNSVWLDGSADHLTRSTTSHSSTECVMACWVQLSTSAGNIGMLGLGTGTSGSTNNGLWFSNGTLYVYVNGNGLTTNAKYRDIGYYHFLVSFKLDEGAAADKSKVFVNGVEVTSFAADPRGSWGTSFASTATQSVGSIFTNTFLNGYVTQAIMLDGQSIQGGDVAITDFLDAFTFGTNGAEFSPKSDADIAALATTAGGNSFCLDFADSVDLGNDISSNANDFTPTSMSSTNQSTNTPSLVYPKISNIGTPSGDAAANYTMGLGSNRMVYSGANQGYKGLLSTQLIQPDDSPIYWEYYLESGSVGGASGGRISVGLCVPHFNVGNANAFAGAGGNNPSNLRGVIYDNGSQGSTTGSTLIGVGDIQNLAFEPSTGKIWFGVNGTWNNGSEAASTTLNPSGHDYQATVQDYVFFISASRSTDIGVMNFGDNPTMSGNITAGGNADENGYGNFAYAVPSGFLAPNSATLTAPDYQGCDWFDAAIYEGTGSEQTVGSGGSDSKFTALAWIKNRDAADDNIWMDRVIGTGGYLSTTQNDSGTAATAYGDGGTDILTSETQAVKTFGQRSVTIGTMDEVNTSGESYVLWQWLIGDTATSAGSITAGSPSLSTTGLVAEPGHFSIAQYTGNGTDNATFAHGLGATPDLVIIKRRSGSATNTDWVTHVVGLGTENYIYPHYRIALSVGAGPNGMVPGADLVEISTGVATNTNGETHMAYSFKNTPGLLRVGTYVGNSSTNGSYVSTGFRPRWIWIFNTTLTSADAERPIIDTARYKFNGSTTAGGSNGGVVFSEQRAAEEAMNTSLGVNPAIDILADGFKLRANDSTINTGTTYLYLAMADIASGEGLCPIFGR